jgi:glycosyltransferase involved in cell wall biosynthesis
MRILFATNAVHNVSTQLNVPNYAKLNELEGVSIDFYNRNYADYDVILFMGYDPHVAEARAMKPSLKIGVIDIRPSSLNASLGADFVIANGFEMQDWLSDYFEKIFIYPIYPQIKALQKQHVQRQPLIIGYHGNKVHLTAVIPHVSAALEKLAEQHKIELWAIYDVKNLGKISPELCDPNRVPVRYIQWSSDVYEKELAQADIGIVPSEVPIHDEKVAKEKIISHSSRYQPHESDYLVRYKNTSNAGRIYVFSQMGIPVVAGLTPSASQAIKHGVNGYLAHSVGGWYSALKKLADSVEHRNQLGNKLYEVFQAEVSVDILNRNLIDFIQNLP